LPNEFLQDVSKEEQNTQHKNHRQLPFKTISKLRVFMDVSPSNPSETHWWTSICISPGNPIPPHPIGAHVCLSTFSNKGIIGMFPVGSRFDLQNLPKGPAASPNKTANGCGSYHPENNIFDDI